MRIDRCICHQVTFEEMLCHARKQGDATLRDLQRTFGCGTECGLCTPYVRRMLTTGETVFTEIITSAAPRGQQAR